MQAISVMNDKYLNPDSEPIFSLYHSKCWALFLYYLSNSLKDINKNLAEQIFYLNKILHGVDWYYEIELPPHFNITHPMGSVLGRAVYGDYLHIYQGVTIGNNSFFSDGRLHYPIIGQRVTFFANATVLGESIIGDNVILSAGSRIINESIPDNSIVFGCSPNLTIKHEELKIDNYLRYIWR